MSEEKAEMKTWEVVAGGCHSRVDGKAAEIKIGTRFNAAAPPNAFKDKCVEVDLTNPDDLIEEKPEEKPEEKAKTAKK